MIKTIISLIIAAALLCGCAAHNRTSRWEELTTNVQRGGTWVIHTDPPTDDTLRRAQE